MPEVDLTVRLQSRAKGKAIVSERDGVLHVSVAAAPVMGQANAALCKLIAKAVGIPPGRVQVVQGKKSPNKLLCLEGLGAAQAADRLA